MKSYFCEKIIFLSIKLNLPNFFTCCNLFSGCIASVLIFRNRLDLAAYFVLLAAVFDLLDGMAARKNSIGSAFGKELDSLADMLSFGFVPGAMMFKLLQHSNMSSYFHSEIFIRFLQFIPFIITVFSALRLAKFNLDIRQTDHFIGLPTPANTILIISLPLILKQFPGRYDAIILNAYFIIITSIICSLLLISELNLFSLKFKTKGIKENSFQYLLIVCALILFPILLYASIPIIIVLYILLSFIQNRLKTKTQL
jgi:CDP-diacylglycerol--serine O-phosphatidyltransferase